MSTPETEHADDPEREEERGAHTSDARHALAASLRKLPAIGGIAFTDRPSAPPTRAPVSFNRSGPDPAPFLPQDVDEPAQVHGLAVAQLHSYLVDVDLIETSGLFPAEGPQQCIGEVQKRGRDLTDQCTAILLMRPSEKQQTPAARLFRVYRLLDRQLLHPQRAFLAAPRQRFRAI